MAINEIDEKLINNNNDNIITTNGENIDNCNNISIDKNEKIHFFNHQPQILNCDTTINNGNSGAFELKYENGDEELDRKHLIPSVVLFILGFILLIPWLINVIHIKSKNRVARSLAIASLAIFCSSIVIVLMLFGLFILFLILCIPE